MAFVKNRCGWFVTGRCYFLPVIFFLLPVVCCQSVRGAWVHPVEGGGNFAITVDAVNRWRSPEQLDVMVLVSAANAQLTMEKEGSRLIGRLRVEAELVAPDGRLVQRVLSVHTAKLSPEEAQSNTSFQVFGVLLRDVPFRAGRLTCRVVDVNRYRKGLVSGYKKRLATSEAVADWYAPPAPEHPEGISLHDPLFLNQAPLRTWNPDALGDEEGPGLLQDYMHPVRRYGLEQDHLQLFLPVWAPPGGIQLSAETAGLRVEASSLDQKYALTDTIWFDELGLAALAAGRSAGLFYELDVNLLPEGSYRLSLAPLDGKGMGVLSGFEVAWTLTAIGRHRNMVLGEGSLVFSGKKRREFLSSSPAQQERMLNDFWEDLNPDPESPINQAYLEFQYRLAYVHRFMGGFGKNGPHDSRGEVFILLGPPDEVQREVMPMNSLDQDDARVKVYKSTALDREGILAKGTPVNTGTPRRPWLSTGGLPMPYSYKADREIAVKGDSPSRSHGFELWRYTNGGNPLYPNIYQSGPPNKRFLFVDQTGSGDYLLESSNVIQGDD